VGGGWLWGGFGSSVVLTLEERLQLGTRQSAASRFRVGSGLGGGARITGEARSAHFSCAAFTTLTTPHIPDLTRMCCANHQNFAFPPRDPGVQIAALQYRAVGHQRDNHNRLASIAALGGEPFS